MNTNYFELNDKSTADKAGSDQSDYVAKVRRLWRWITGGDDLAQDEKVTSPKFRDSVNISKHIRTTDNESTEIKDYHVGKRLVRVAVLAICYFVVEIIAKALTVAQFIFVAWKKRPHPGMQRLGTMIAEYMLDLWRYCTFASDNPPWPFRR